MQEITQEKFAQIVELLKTKKSLTEIIILAGVTPQIVARVNRIAKVRKTASKLGNNNKQCFAIKKQATSSRNCKEKKKNFN